MKIKDSDVFFHSEGLRVREEENNEITIYDRNSEQIHELNSSAAEIFRSIGESGEILKIIEQYKRKYNLTPEKSRADITSTVQKFLKLHLIKKIKSS